MVRFFYIKYIKNVKFDSGSRGPHGPDLSSPCGQKFQFSSESASSTRANRGQFRLGGELKTLTPSAWTAPWTPSMGDPMDHPQFFLFIFHFG